MTFVNILGVITFSSIVLYHFITATPKDAELQIAFAFHRHAGQFVTSASSLMYRQCFKITFMKAESRLKQERYRELSLQTFHSQCTCLNDQNTWLQSCLSSFIASLKPSLQNSIELNRTRYQWAIKHQLYPTQYQLYPITSIYFILSALFLRIIPHF